MTELIDSFFQAVCWCAIAFIAVIFFNYFFGMIETSIRLRNHNFKQTIKRQTVLINNLINKLGR